MTLIEVIFCFIIGYKTLIEYLEENISVVKMGIQVKWYEE